MIDLARTRPGLGLGRYLFFNPALRAIFSGVDALGRMLRGDPAQETAAVPTKILVSLQAHIGDVIIGTCVLRVLKLAFPDAAIGFLTHPGSRVVLDGNPLVQRVHGFEHWKLNRRKISLPRKIWQHICQRRKVIAELKAEHYDLAIDLYAYFPNSIPMLAAAGIPVRVGWTSGGFGPWLTHSLDWNEGRSHVVEWHKRLLGVIKACRPHLDSAAPMLEADPLALKAWSAISARERIGVRYVVFHVGIGSEKRRWLDSEWRGLAQRCDAIGVKVLLMGQGAIDESLCSAIAKDFPQAINLAGKLSWQEMSVALAGAQVVVGLDSMSSHVAAAWQVPTLCITTGLTDPIWRPYGPKTRVVLTPTPCAPCYLPNGCDSMDCIRQTSAATVFEVLSDMLHGHSYRPPFESAA